MKLSTKIFILFLLNWIDGLSTLHFINIYGEQIEQNPLGCLAFRIIGLEYSILLKILVFGAALIISLLLYDEEYPTSNLVNMLTNIALVLYLLVCIIHIGNFIL